MANYHKYNNKKVIVNGIKFDSQKEAKRYQELSMFEKAGVISGLQMQVKFLLVPAQYEIVERHGKKGQKLPSGKKCVEKECSYYADFVYKRGGETIVEDTKGFKTPEYIIKRKLMLYKYGIKIKEV